ncbi:hypothetical protein RHSIM_Rhsim12G0035200 [Rhododendron simsii]|uniref:rRNA N-glycosidase n=1 Tax=Rhododendron simsii TaxID=118357 RepID=A0A834G1J2_RHOSS|nr:hypothetical protein RHSIM_Rhsim12G0035200 [Rhododendron simsii]
MRRTLAVVFVILTFALLLSTSLPRKADGRVFYSFKVLQSNEFSSELILKTGTNRAYFLSRFLAEGLVPPSAPNPDTYIPHQAHARFVQGPPTRSFDDMLSLIDPIISPECNDQLSREVTREEVQLALGSLSTWAFESPWGTLLKEVNQTNVTLIFKVPNPEDLPGAETASSAIGSAPFNFDIDWSDGRRWKEARDGHGEGKRGGDKDGPADDEERDGEREAAEDRLSGWGW